MLKSSKKFFKKVYKIIINRFFLIIHNKPRIISQKLKDNTYKETKIKIEKNNYSIYQLINGRIYTDSNDTTAYITEKNYLSRASMQYYKFDSINSYNGSLSKNKTLVEGTPKIKKKINGKVLSLLSGGASKDNFTHWFTDVIPRIEIFNRKYNLKKIDKFYVPSLKYNFQRESLEILGIKENKIITSEKYKHICADKIYATSHPCFHLPTKVKKWSINFLNKSYSTSNYKNKFNKIFIDRDQLKMIKTDNLEKYRNLRILLNENEIKNFLISEGYEIIKPENYSFKEQVKIFSSTHCVVGLYGAAMMMIAFCKKNTKVIEIKPISGGNEFLNISKINKLKHRQINLKPIMKSSIKQNGLLNCPIGKIRKHLI